MTVPTQFSAEPPYWAVIFASTRTREDDGYAAMAERMIALASGRDGFLGMDSARGGDGLGITVSYWRDLDAIAAWKADAEHRVAQEFGQERWYSRYTLRVARVERAVVWPRDQ
ncbi:MAG TPA: antibiotic biosynthesis monooxygenase [Magnetospirillum sp.]|nr:antibiotic biosynthesis monooxygenase [Magnetospirillum sp.]